jgi:hypothetical protein
VAHEAQAGPAAQVSKILCHLGLDDRVPPLAPPRDLDAQLDLAPTDLDAPAPPCDPGAHSLRDLDAPFLPDPDPPAAAGGSFDPYRDLLPPDDFADPAAPE